jgi:hypothetical protein
MGFDCAVRVPTAHIGELLTELRIVLLLQHVWNAACGPDSPLPEGLGRYWFCSPNVTGHERTSGRLSSGRQCNPNAFIFGSHGDPRD